MTQLAAEDKTAPSIKTDRLPPVVTEHQRHDGPEHRSWAHDSPVRILGVVLMLLMLWYSMSGRICRNPREVGQSPHDDTEKGILQGSADVKTSKGRPPYREYRRHEIHNSITGHFELHDLLELTSQSGSIDITFTPQPRKTRAVLHVGTRSGSIRVRVAPEFLSAAGDPLTAQGQEQSPGANFSSAELQKTLSRPFTNDIHSESGSITATVLTGNGDPTHVAANSGPLILDIMTVGVGKNNPRSLLDTSTNSGSQTVRVMPLNILEDPTITRLAGQHISRGSGSMNFYYSDEWRGNVRVVSAGSGNIDVEGRDLQIDLRESHRVEAYRGKGELVNIVSQGSGSVTFSN